MTGGVGIDVVEVPRLERALARWGDRFVGRVFSARERQDVSGRRGAGAGLAGRFAAKEAVLKALGARRPLGARWREIEIVREPGGRPTVALSGRARALFDATSGRALHLSIAHERTVSVAVAVLEV